MSDDKQITVLAERDKEILVRIDDKVILGDKIYKSVRHEWWYDKDKMEQGIPSDGEYIYMRGFSGSKDEELIKLFNKNF